MIIIFFLIVLIQSNLYSENISFIKNFSGAKLYKAPHVKSKSFKNVKYGTRLALTGVIGPIDIVQNELGQWIEVTFGGEKFWIFNNQLTNDSNLVTENGGVLLDKLNKKYLRLSLFEGELIFHHKCEFTISSILFLKEDMILKLEYNDGKQVNLFEIYSIQLISETDFNLVLKSSQSVKSKVKIKMISSDEVSFTLDSIQSQFVSEIKSKDYKTREENCDKNKSK